MPIKYDFLIIKIYMGLHEKKRYIFQRFNVKKIRK
jgi:hypothetical protein